MFNPRRQWIRGRNLNDLLVRFLNHPNLGIRIVAIGLVLTSPCLLLGFYLDDYIARYIYSDLEGAKKLYRICAGLYGLATGNAEENHWQIEAGHAPWWMPPDFLLRSFRPISLATHLLDARLGLDNAFIMHAHSYVWFALLVLIAFVLFRSILGPVVGGFAALLFTVDHTHGFIVGFICNRHALVTAVFGLLCLYRHHRWRSLRRDESRVRYAVIAWLLYAIALLGGDSGLSIGGYLFAYAAFAEEGTLRHRALSFFPYFIITLVWRVAVAWMGYGARGSGIYVDPIQDPIHFVPIFVERLPILLLGQFVLPPAELSPIYQSWMSFIVWSSGVFFLILLCIALIPLMKQNRITRFWAAGFILSLVPASLILPHSRQLLLSSVGAMAIVSQLWHFYYAESMSAPKSITGLTSRSITALILLVHLWFSPIALPFTTCSIALTAPMHEAADVLGSIIADRDIVFVTMPDFIAVKLTQLRKRIDRQPLPRRWRTLSAGPEQVTAYRTASDTLTLDIPGGMLKGPLTTLFRDSRLRMTVSEQVVLQGLEITVLAITHDGRARRVAFRFDESIDSPRFLFYIWAHNTLVPFTPPPVGRSVALPPAIFDPF
jgi:hypothetical protein